MSNVENLKKEITALEKDTISDGSTVMIEHLILKYDKGKLNIKPAYQRVFRWTKEQKSNFIESLLLGIPLPSMFVAEDENGKWEVVDGLQRISTILEFTQNSIFKKDYIKTKDSILGGLNSGQRLNYLDGITWNMLPEKYQNRILDTKIYIGVIKNTGDIKAKFELFQRLNTGGTKLSNQEVRNCLLVDKKEEIYNNLYEIANNKQFLELINNIKIEKIVAEENMELVLRCLALQNIKLEKSNIKIEKIVDDFIYNIIGLENDLFKNEINIKQEFNYFLKTIKLIFNLKKTTFNKTGKKQFIYPLYDTISSGISYNLKKGNIDVNNPEDKDEIQKRINEIQNNDEYMKGIGTGVSSQRKLKFASIFGKKYFNLK